MSYATIRKSKVYHVISPERFHRISKFPLSSCGLEFYSKEISEEPPERKTLCKRCAKINKNL